MKKDIEDKKPEAEISEPEVKSQWQQQVFNTQAEAYSYLQWACPHEYHFTVGVDRATQNKVVVVNLKVG